MSNDKLTKKLAIFHHPLFQNICDKWSDFLGPSKTSLNLITFCEINIRIQRAIMSDFNFENALASALNDWLQEVESLSSHGQPSPTKRPHGHKNNRKEENIFILLNKMLIELTFEPSEPIEVYIDFIHANRHHEALNYVKDNISFKGFMKFVLDLCYSWCEELDLELFSIFINSVLIQLTTGNTQGERVIKKSSQIQSLPENFLSQHKRLKTHYHRYKRPDLCEYESWYEWNYTQTRINEMRERSKEILINCFPEEEGIGPYIDSLHLKSISQIMEEGLALPTTKHFTFYMDPKDEKGQDLGDNSYLPEAQSFDVDTLKAVDDISPISKAASAHKRVLKKLTLPIFGRTIPKPPPEEVNKTHTIKSLTTFLDPPNDDDLDLSEPDVNQGLCPIYEDETSENNTVRTTEPNNYHLTSEDSLLGGTVQNKKSSALPPQQKPPAFTRKSSIGVKKESLPRGPDPSYGEIYSSFLTSSHPNKTESARNNSMNSSMGFRPPSGKSKAVHNQGVKTPLVFHDTIDLLEKNQERLKNAALNNSSVQSSRRSSVPRNRDFGGWKAPPEPSANSSMIDPYTKARGRVIKGGASANKLSLAGRSASHVPEHADSSLILSPEEMEYGEQSVLPKIRNVNQSYVQSRKGTNYIHIGEKLEKGPMFDEGNLQLHAFDPILSKLNDKFFVQAKIQHLKPEKLRPDSLGYKWQVEETFDEAAREEMLEKMNKRLERNKRRQEHRSLVAQGKKKGRKFKDLDAGKRVKVFLNKDNRSLFKQVFT